MAECSTPNINIICERVNGIIGKINSYSHVNWAFIMDE